MTINDPLIISELAQCHSLYEKALVENDLAMLDALFWDSPHAVRLGATENLHGNDEIRQFRLGRPKINLARDVGRTDIMAFGDGAGVINLEFVRVIDGVERNGRQTQVWIKLPGGWRIVSAHISLLAPEASYLDAASAQIRLPIDAKSRAAVNQDLAQLKKIAEFLMEFPLEQNVEAAPVFQP
jgi:hypothetical protein